MNIGDAEIHKTADLIRVGWDAERYRRFIGRRTAANVDNKPRVRDLDVTRRAFAIASTLNATSEHRFVKSKRSRDVGDGNKVRDGNPVLRRHLIDFLLDLRLVGSRLQFRHCISPFSRIDPQENLEEMRSRHVLAVSEGRLALPDFYDVAVRVANVAARFAVLVLWLSEKRGSSASPEFIARMNIRNADIHEAADGIGIGGNAKRYRWFVGCGTALDVDNEPRVCDLDEPRRALAVASGQDTAAEDLFVKSKGSFDVSDSDKVCDDGREPARPVVGG